MCASTKAEFLSVSLNPSLIPSNRKLRSESLHNSFSQAGRQSDNANVGISEGVSSEVELW